MTAKRFIQQQIFIKHPLCTRHCSRHWGICHEGKKTKTKTAALLKSAFLSGSGRLGGDGWEGERRK